MARHTWGGASTVAAPGTMALDPHRCPPDDVGHEHYTPHARTKRMPAALDTHRLPKRLSVQGHGQGPCYDPALLGSDGHTDDLPRLVPLRL